MWELFMVVDSESGFTSRVRIVRFPVTLKPAMESRGLSVDERG
jgi:hypothetical protein